MRTRLLHYFQQHPGSARFWLFLAMALSGLFGFFEVVDDVFQDPSEGDDEAIIFDKWAFSVLHGLRGNNLNQAMTDFTALGSFSVITLVSVALLIFLYNVRDRAGILYLAAVLMGTSVLGRVLKLVFERDRPDVAGHLVKVHDFSFPSGHSFGAAACYFAFAFLISRYTRSPGAEIAVFAFATLIVGLVGLSRIYLGVHYASDVMAGICAGAAWSALLSAGYERYYRKKAGVVDRP